MEQQEFMITQMKLVVLSGKVSDLNLRGFLAKLEETEKSGRVAAAPPRNQELHHCLKNLALTATLLEERFKEIQMLSRSAPMPEPKPEST